jgi:hypothetical protein
LSGWDPVTLAVDGGVSEVLPLVSEMGYERASVTQFPPCRGRSLSVWLKIKEGRGSPSRPILTFLSDATPWIECYTDRLLCGSLVDTNSADCHCFQVPRVSTDDSSFHPPSSDLSGLGTFGDGWLVAGSEHWLCRPPAPWPAAAGGGLSRSIASELRPGGAWGGLMFQPQRR